MKHDCVLVSGGRDYKNRARVHSVLTQLRPARVVQGGCPTGVDFYAREWCEEFGAQSITFHANWKYHGRSAGPMRNLEMAVFSGATLALIFPGGKGTASCEKACKSVKDLVLHYIS